VLPLAAGAPIGHAYGLPGAAQRILADDRILASDRILANDKDSLIWWHYVRLHRDDVGTALVQHIQLTAIAVGVGLLVSVPLALLARRYRVLSGPILAVSGVLYTIPSLALLYLIGPLTGFTSLLTVETALVTYTLLILVRNILTGLESVSPDVTEAARGMGFTDQALLWRVEVPLALPSIVAGIRIATVTTIGLASLAALLTQGGLGDLILDGINRRFPTPLMVGSLLVIALAVVADLILLGAQRLLSPWARSRARAGAAT
jgi:osmoprotectant transport system permease protein